ncbi:MAG: hypothetical protein LUD48_03215 [Prevotella sp.]|nr:hypothetical protein [Prevotella sp.]
MSEVGKNDVLIRDWMYKMKMQTVDREVYAIIYEYTHNHSEHKLMITEQELADRININKRRLIDVLQRLLKNGYIIRETTTNPSVCWYSYKTVA